MPLAEKYKALVKAGSMTAGAVGVPGAFSFGLDVSVMAGIWTTMLMEIAKRSGRKVSQDFGVKLVTGVLAGVAAYIGGSKLAMKLLHLIPGAGTLAAIGVNSFLNLFFTWRFGNAMAKLFERGAFDKEDFGDIVAYTLAIIMPFPTPGELGEMVSVMRDTSLDIPETFKIFEQHRRG